MGWSCSVKNLILSAANVALASFASVTSALQAAGTISADKAASLHQELTTGISTIQGVITDISGGKMVLPEVASVLQTVVDGFNAFSMDGLPAPVVAIVNLVNISVQAVIAAIQTQVSMNAAVLGAQAHEVAYLPISGQVNSRDLHNMRMALDAAQQDIDRHISPLAVATNPGSPKPQVFPAEQKPLDAVAPPAKEAYPLPVHEPQATHDPVPATADAK